MSRQVFLSDRFQFGTATGKLAWSEGADFAAIRRKTTPFEGLNQWMAGPKCFGISGPFCSLTGSNPVGDANKVKGLDVIAFPASREDTEGIPIGPANHGA